MLSGASLRSKLTTTSHFIEAVDDANRNEAKAIREERGSLYTNPRERYRALSDSLRAWERAGEEADAQTNKLPEPMNREASASSATIK